MKQVLSTQVQPKYYNSLVLEQRWLEFPDRVGVNALSLELARNLWKIWFGEVAISDNDVAVLASEYLPFRIDLNQELLLFWIESDPKNSVVEVDIWPQLEVVHVFLDMVMELRECQEGAVLVLRRKIHHSHGLHWDIGDELLVGGVGNVSEETEEVIGLGSVGLGERREVPLASYIGLRLEEVDWYLASEVTKRKEARGTCSNDTHLLLNHVSAGSLAYYLLMLVRV